MTATVQVSGLGKRYRAATALDDVSLELAAGRVYLLVGPDGAGKTTLLRVLAGLARPTGGSVEILGRPFPPCSARRRSSERAWADSVVSSRVQANGVTCDLEVPGECNDVHF
jgi:ABC-type multidrug transport system ATPase subunit